MVDALEAARRVAKLVGLPAADAKTVYVGSSVIVSFGPAGPIARVGGLTAGVRDLFEHYTREVSVAKHLAGAGAPVVHPWQPAGPFVEASSVVSLWHLVDGPGVATSEEAGTGLRRCHNALRTFPGALPPLESLLDEAERIASSVTCEPADRTTFGRAIASSREALGAHGLPEQPLHGDAGMGNVLGQGLWHDWEDCCRGPVVWDLASLVSTARILGRERERERAEDALQAYGDAPGLEMLDTFVAIRGLQVLAWSLHASAAEGRLRPTTRARLQWLRGHEWQTSV